MIGQNNENIFNINRSLVIQYLQRNKIATRSQLSKSSNLTPAAITKIVQELIELSLIEETGFYAGKKGRRSVGIKLREDFLFIGAKISRRNYSVGVFDFNAEQHSYYTETYDDETLRFIIERIKCKIQEFIKKFNNIVSIGIAVPGPYLDKKSQIVLVTETRGWEDVNLKEAFGDNFGIPITIMHDANSCALADWWFGDYEFSKTQTLVHMLVGEGVGSGVVINGKVFTGNDGLSGEIGHISIDVAGPRCKCGNYGCLEAYCSSIALIKRAKAVLPKYPTSSLNTFTKINLSDVFTCAKEGDELALLLVQDSGKYIGYGVVNIINMYNPSIVVLGNQMLEDSSIILPEILRVVEERIPKPFQETLKIVVSKFKDDPTLYGAAAVAMDYCLNNHSSLIERQD